jgi:hypothetical protein
VQTAADGKLRLEAWQNGQYDLTMVSGRTLQCKVDTDHDNLRFYMTIQATSEKTTTNRTGSHAPS